MNPKYRFFLQLNGGGEKIAANPVFKDDMTLDYELESNQRFYRAKLSGKFSFVRQDFATIMGAAFETVYYFYIEKSDDWGQTWTQYYKSMFMRTDCTINMDDQIISVQPNPVDQYNDVLAGLEKEYNLISLAPEIARITIQKRPLIQVYAAGESVVSCFIGGLAWEQDANPVTNDNDLREIYHFAPIEENISIVLSARAPQNEKETEVYNENADIINNSVGTYVGTVGERFVNNVNGYYITCPPSTGGRFYLYNSNDEQLLFTPIYTNNNPTAYGSSFRFELSYDEETEKGGTQTIAFPVLYQSSNINASIYSRYLLDVDSIDGLETYELLQDDIVAYNRNYRRVIDYSFPDTITLSTNFSDTPTEWGLANNGKYFLPPESILEQKFYPVARSTWGDFSIWFNFHVYDEVFESQGRKTYVLCDNYPVSSVISVLLKQFAPDITHEPTVEYSSFLYGNYNPITGYDFRLFVTPKSNILVGDYQTPVQKAPTTLQQFLDMLRNTFQLYWHIEDNKLKIEHISWYRNGGSYNGNPVVGYDLTTLENIRNGKKWAFGTSEYSFDKEDMPERYQFKWADDVTEAFEGQPIQVVSKYVQAGKIEEINIGGFTSDVDLMLLNPDEISQDGFALMAAEYRNGQWQLPLVRRDVDNVTYYLQNGYLAMINLQPQYWLYDMPARNLIVNGVEVGAYGIQRRKSQTLTFPVGNDEPDLLQLVKTYIGNGQYEKLSINLSSRTAEATLKYDTE